MQKWTQHLAQLSLLSGMVLANLHANAHNDQWSFGIAVGNPSPPATAYYPPPPAYYLPPEAYYPPPAVVYRHPHSRHYSVPNAVYQPVFPRAMPYYGHDYEGRGYYRRQDREDRRFDQRDDDRRDNYRGHGRGRDHDHDDHR